MNMPIPLHAPHVLTNAPITLHDLAETFRNTHDRVYSSQWENVSYIIFYDDLPLQTKDVASILSEEFYGKNGWTGKICILEGGFVQCAKEYPELIELHHIEKA